LVKEIQPEGHPLQTVVGVQGSPISAEAVDAGGNLGAVVVKPCLLARAALKTAWAAVPEERGIRAAGKIEPLRVVGVGDVVVDRTIPYREVSVAVHSAEAGLKTIAAEGAGFAARRRIGADRPLQRLVHIGHIEVLEKFLRHDRNRRRSDFQRGISAPAGQGIPTKIAPILGRAYFEWRKLDFIGALRLVGLLRGDFFRVEPAVVVLVVFSEIGGGRGRLRERRWQQGRKRAGEGNAAATNHFFEG